MNAEKVAADFARATRGYKVTVLHEDGEYRHLRFGVPGERAGSTDVHTWPGGVATSGDMADGWMFQRGLGFFAGAPNLHYWQEKLAPSCRQLSKVFSIETLRASVLAAAADMELPEYDRGAFDEDLAGLIASIEHENAQANAALMMLDDYIFVCADGAGPELRFTDAWEMEVRDYSYTFVWACHVLSTVAGAYAPVSGKPGA